MFGDRFSSSTSCSRWVHETEPDRPDQSLTCCFLKVATHPARLNIKNSVSRSSVLQLKMNDLRNQFFSEDDGATQSRIQEQLQATLQELETNKQEIQTARQALQQLEREASQAGIPPESVRQMVGELPKEESIVNSPGN